VAARAAAAAPPLSLLLVGNSLPIRALEIYARPEHLTVLTQRGASGIDGLVAGAAGAAATGIPTTLLIGDVTYLHDVGGLAAARAARTPLVVVVVNNQGGRIFELLPVARADVDVTLFTTPHALDLAHGAALYGLPHRRATSAAELDAALAEAHARDGATVVEAVVPPDGAAAQARALAAALETS
jgi:2-succinyl-5-enolpyruvyl-6-hydroxy-3-cyclohexene-1-carboxylate synthase